MGSEKLIGYLKDIKFSFNSYTMNLPSIMLGKAAVEDRGYFELTTGKIVKTRERFTGSLYLSLRRKKFPISLSAINPTF